MGDIVGGRVARSAGLVEYAMDLAMIQRNVRDLAKTASYSHMDELEELHKLAYSNLRSKMGPGGPLAEDPTLCMEAFKLISSVTLQTIEIKRKAADTLIKARCLLDGSLPSTTTVEVGDEDPLDSFPDEGVVIQEAGVFGGVSGDEVDDADASPAQDSVAG
jgi:hypothetical protein